MTQLGDLMAEADEADFQYVHPTEGRLAQLLAVYESAKAAADEASAHLKTITDAIKSEVTTSYTDGLGDAYKGYILGHDCITKPLKLLRVTQQRLQSKLLREHRPDIYQEFTKETTYWTLK